MNKLQLISSLKKEHFSPQIIKAFKRVPREDFMPENLKSHAYDDNAFPIGQGQTISQPYTIAVMLNLLDVKKGQKVLELGSGSGYVLALLSELVGNKGQVYGVEIVKELFEKSKINLKNYDNIELFNKTGTNGLKEKSPFDRILISAALEKIPEAILNQIKERGIFVAPIGKYQQSLMAIKRLKNNFKMIKEIPGFIFVRFV